MNCRAEEAVGRTAHLARGHGAEEDQLDWWTRHKWRDGRNARAKVAELVGVAAPHIRQQREARLACQQVVRSVAENLCVEMGQNLMEIVGATRQTMHLGVSKKATETQNKKVS